MNTNSSLLARLVRISESKIASYLKFKKIKSPLISELRISDSTSARNVLKVRPEPLFLNLFKESVQYDALSIPVLWGATRILLRGRGA